MPNDKVLSPLLRVPLFAELKPLQITEIARHAERMSFRRGSTITQSGTVGDGAILIVSGDAVRVPEPGSQDAPHSIAPGSLVGELAMLIDHMYGATVMAETRVHCLKITRRALYEQMENDPALADHFASRLAARLAQVAAEMRAIDQMLARAATPKLATTAGADAPTSISAAH